MIFPIWQPLHSSSHKLAEQSGALLAEKATHTGTLDPLAEGVLVILTGEDRFAKGLLKWDKTYQFTVLWGVSTDSQDKLGLIQSTAATIHSEDAIAKVIAYFPNQYAQNIPLFSARRISGQSSFDLAKTTTAIEPKTRTVTLSDLQLISTEVISGSEVLTQHAAVMQVEGAFRQSEVHANWQQIILPEQQYLLSSFQVTVSTGTYIRQLTTDIAAKLHVPAVTWSITRIQNGPYTVDDCLELSELEHLNERVKA